jgi:hypothetical protein
MVVGRLAERPLISTYHVTSIGKAITRATRMQIKISVKIIAAFKDLLLPIVLYS